MGTFFYRISLSWKGPKGLFFSRIYFRGLSIIFFYGINIRDFAYHRWKRKNFFHFSIDQIELHDIEVLMCCLKTTWISITWYNVLIPWRKNCFQTERSILHWHKWHTKFMYIIIHVNHLIVLHFNKITFDRIIYADIKLNPKSLNWQILKMKICFFLLRAKK